MGYLIIKMLFLLLIASALGFVLGWWWVRRRFVDVTEEHWRFADLATTAESRDYAPRFGELSDQLGTLRDEVRNNRPAKISFAPLEERLGALDKRVSQIKPPAVADLSGLEKKIASLEAALRTIPKPLAAKPVDLSPLELRLVGLEKTVGSLKMPNVEPVRDNVLELREMIANLPQPKNDSVDLAPVVTRLDELEQVVRGIRIPEAPEPDLSPVQVRLEELEQAVRSIRIPEVHETDLAPVHARLGDLESAIRSIHIPEHRETDLSPLVSRMTGLEERVARSSQQVESVDLAPVQSRLAELEAAIRSIPKPEFPEVPAPVDLSPLLTRLASLESSIVDMPRLTDLSGVQTHITELESMIAALPAPQQVDVAPLERGLSDLAVMVRSMPKPEKVEVPTVNLAPIDSHITEVDSHINELDNHISTVESLLRNLKFPESEGVDLAPIDSRLIQLEVALNTVLGKLEKTATPPPTASSGAGLLKKASYGAKDDLKRISGVGPKLEKLLNGIGVFYFWQVAAWSPKDVREVDELLDVFKGRIERDSWVVQAGELAATSQSRPPNRQNGEELTVR